MDDTTTTTTTRSSAPFRRLVVFTSLVARPEAQA